MRALQKLREAKIARADPNDALKRTAEKKKSEDKIKEIASRAGKSVVRKSDENDNPNAEEGSS